VLSIASKETGHSPTELHYYFKHKIIGDVEWLPSTKELWVTEFSWYLEEVLNTLAKQGIIIEDAF